MYLSDCLDSLISQTYKNIEIVVVDAFSTDGSRTLLDYYQSLDSRIKLIYSDSYIKFPAISYNLGFLSCSGDFIAINDPDDISMPDRIQKQVTYLVNNPIVDVVGCNCIEFNDLITRKSVSSVENNLKNAAPPARNPSLMFRKILYTSVSRSKRKVYLLALNDSVSECTNNIYEVERLTKLKHFLTK
jgi:glycosyltransferase involved in cell wall biosynthesis